MSIAAARITHNKRNSGINRHGVVLPNDWRLEGPLDGKPMRQPCGAKIWDMICIHCGRKDDFRRDYHSARRRQPCKCREVQSTFDPLTPAPEASP